MFVSFEQASRFVRWLFGDALSLVNIIQVPAAYQRDHPGRPWAAFLQGPSGDDMVAAMDAVGVDGALLASPFRLYR